MDTTMVKNKRVLIPSQPDNSLASPPPKKMKEGSGTPPAVTLTNTPASGAQTVKTKKVKHPIFETILEDKSANEKIRAEREEAYNRAKEYLRKAPGLPLNFEDVTVENLGQIMVEKGVDPAFHSAFRLWPIGYKAVYQDAATSTRYVCEILDGMDTKLRKNAPAFIVRTDGHMVTENSAYAAWKAMMEWQIAHGSPAQQAAAREWDPKSLVDRFGLQNKEIRKRLEGLPGAKECSKYQFMGTTKVANSGRANSAAAVGSNPPEPKSKKLKIEKPSTDENKKGATVKKSRGPSAFFVFHAEIKDEVKAQVQSTQDGAVPGAVSKVISSRWAALPDETKQLYQAKARGQMHMRDENESAESPTADSIPTEQEQEPEQEPEPEPEPADTSLYRSEGPYVGERARRFIFNDKDQPIDVADGVIFGYLSIEDQGEDLYISEETNGPAALWRIRFDDTAFGTEDLEEHEVNEAIALLKEPLSEKLQQKHEKRLEKLAQRKAKIAERQADRDRLRQEKEAEKDRLRLEKERIRAEKSKLSDTGGVSALQSRLEPLDERMKLIPSGPHAGKQAYKVPIPAGACSTFPPQQHAADFLALYAFLRDLSGPLGAVRMSFDELRVCFEDGSERGDVGVTMEVVDASEQNQSSPAQKKGSHEPSGLESFCELATWLTKLAVRAKYIRDEEESGEYEMLRMKCYDPVQDIKLSPGPLLSPNMKDSESINYSCWHLVNETSWPEIARILIKTCPVSDKYDDLLQALDSLDPQGFSQSTKFAVLSFLLDEVCESDKVRKILNSKLRDADRIQDKKRIEDAALRKNKELLKPKQRTESESGSAEAGGANKLKPMATLELMKLLHDQDPQPFEFKYYGQVYKAVLDTSGLIPKLKTEDQVFDSPLQWIAHIRKKEKMHGTSAKAIIFYQGKALKDREQEIIALNPPRVGGEETVELAAEDEAGFSVDTERRKREFESALARAEKGLRLEAVGLDRLYRRYWCLDGLTDRVWVSPASKAEESSKAPSDFGFDGERTKEFAALRRATEEGWICYSLHDDTLKALYNYLANGPMGARESQLMEQMREHKIRGGFSESDGPQESCESDKVVESDEGYEWIQLPHIGDIVWARKGSDPKTALWFPVLVVDPEEDATAADKESEYSSEEEWQTSGSEYIRKRVLVTIFDNRKNKEVKEKGRIVGWLPADIADFKSEKTGEHAALWRVKLDDKAYSSQDLEEYEVKEAMRNYAKAEALKKSKDSEFLSRNCMFGQSVKWLYGQYMDDSGTTECFPLKDVLPFVEFREERIQEMRRANKAKVLQQVERANQYLEEHSSNQDKKEDLKEILRELGLSIRTDPQENSELQASCRHCMRYPRIMTVIQRNLDNTPFVSTVGELRAQLLAFFNKLQISFIDDDDTVSKFDEWHTVAESATTLSDIKEALVSIESLLGNISNDKTEEISFVSEGDKWRTDGHEWIGKRLRRPVKGKFGHTIDHVKAKVVGWLAADESDFFDENGIAAALWHVLWEDGDEEDLEDFEVREGFRSLIESGDSPDFSGEHGIWNSPRDRDCWVKLVANAKTMGAFAFALYLLGDRALHYVSILTKDARFTEEEWDDHCYISGEGGNLVCCDSCPRTALPASLGLNRAPKGDFFCAYCVREQNRRARHSYGGSPNPAPERAAQRSSAVSASSKPKKQAAKGAARGTDVVERMRRNIAKHGLHDGSVCEIQVEARSSKREERCFVKVLDGNVDKSTDDPAIKSCQYFTEWRAKDAKPMQLSRKRGPVPVRMIIQAGSTVELLEGDHRAGFTPNDGN